MAKSSIKGIIETNLAAFSIAKLSSMRPSKSTTSSGGLIGVKNLHSSTL